MISIYLHAGYCGAYRKVYTGSTRQAKAVESTRKQRDTSSSLVGQIIYIRDDVWFLERDYIEFVPVVKRQPLCLALCFLYSSTIFGF